MTHTDSSREVIEIKFSDIVSFIRRYFWFFVIVGISSIVVGYMMSYLFDEEYESSAVILPEYSSGANTSMGLGDWAGLAGLMGRNRTDALRPDLYPEVFSSFPFVIRLVSTQFTNIEGQKMTLMDLLTTEEDSIQSFSDELIRGDYSIIKISPAQHRFLNGIRRRVKVDYGKLTGVLSLTIELPDPNMAAEAVLFSINYLEKFVESYRTDKAADKVEELELLVASARKDYHDMEVKLNRFRDSNRNIFTNLNRVEEQRLETEYSRTRSVYLEMAQKLEVAKLQREENAPVLKVMNPPVVPYATSKPRRLVMAAGYGLLFSFIALLYVLFIREKIHKKFIFETE